MSSRAHYRFGIFEVDLRAGELRKGGTRIRIQRQPLKVLSALLERPGEVVTREELRQKLWPSDTFVDFEHGLNAAVTRLRQALHDSADTPRFIETIERTGYRFFAANCPTDGKSASSGPAGTLGHPETELESRAAPPGSLAVLPLVNLSSDPTFVFFSDGLTEEITNALARVRGLHIVARTSAFQFRGTAQDVREIGARLNVRSVLEGSVRTSGSRLRVAVQLINVQDGYHLWSDVYERAITDVFSVQDEITHAVVDALKAKLTSKPASRAVDFDTYLLYLKARFFRNKVSLDGFLNSIKYYQMALDRDPRYAPAYAGLGEAWGNLGWNYSYLSPRDAYSRAAEFTNQALLIDDELPDAHVSLGLLKLHYEWDWAGTEAAFRRALALDPDHVNAHHRYSHYLVAMSRLGESLSESLLCLSLDPLDPTICHHLGWHYRMARQYDDAISQHQRVLEMNPERELTHIFLGQTYVQNGMHKQAIHEYETAFQLGRGAARDLAWLAHAHAVAGERESALEELDRMLHDAEATYVSPYSIGMVYLALGDLDSAFKWFEKAFFERDPNLVYAGIDPNFEHVYTNSTFQSLLQRMLLSPGHPAESQRSSSISHLPSG